MHEKHFPMMWFLSLSSDVPKFHMSSLKGERERGERESGKGGSRREEGRKRERQRGKERVRRGMRLSLTTLRQIFT